jgi:hypothetical protein
MHCPNMSSITPVDTTTMVPNTLSRRFRKPAAVHATTSLRVVSDDICGAMNRARFDWSSAPGDSRQQLSARQRIGGEHRLENALLGQPAPPQLGGVLLQVEDALIVRLGEKRDVVRLNKTHDPDGEVEFRKLEHAFETQAFQDRLIPGGARRADALFKIHAGPAHVF